MIFKLLNTLIIILLCGTLSYGQEINKVKLTEYHVKAAYLYYLAKFVEWPDSAFAEPDDPITIGILGDDPFGNYLDTITADKIVQGKKLSIKRFDDHKKMTYCHLLFISSSESKKLVRIFNELRGRSTLTVGDVDRFLLEDGIVNLKVIDNKVGIEINLKAAEKANLKISSNLLRYAEIIE